ncbi:thiol peroxidase [Bdellovibrio sp. BCCA]|uniref:thiol peroxidase n=1 Tax=unclassified Bdellovibrio TaxID=2633795 RepID=UPI002601475E|nr:thiol peroxidase [uncultured Bdellovibrio sp.]
MAKITLKGNAVNTSGQLPEKGSAAKDFKLVKNDLSEVTLSSYAGKKKVLNIFPSVDTGTCAASVRKFNQEAAKLNNTVVLNISADLPFAQARFCGAEGIKNCETISSFRSSFGKDWGLQIEDSPLAGLLSRAVVTLSEDNKVLYCEQVSEIVNEPNYEAALASVVGK